MPGTRTVENGGFLEAFYTIKKDDRPLIVPLLRYDAHGIVNGTRKQHLVASATYYPRENVRVLLEGWKVLKEEEQSGANGHGHGGLDNRFLVQVEVGF